MFDEELFNSFSLFLQSQYAEENLNFYKETFQFSSKEWKSKSEMKVEAKNICDKYLGTGTEEPILNISEFIRSNTIRRLKKCTPQMFGLVFNDIECLLRTKYLQFECE